MAPLLRSRTRTASQYDIQTLHQLKLTVVGIYDAGWSWASRMVYGSGFFGPRAGQSNGSLSGHGALGGTQFHNLRKFSANAPHASDSRFANTTEQQLHQPPYLKAQSHGSNHAQSAGLQPSSTWSHESLYSQVGTDRRPPNFRPLPMGPPMRMGFSNEYEPSSQHGVPAEHHGLHSQRSEDFPGRNTNQKSHVAGFQDAVYGHQSAQHHVHNRRGDSRGGGCKRRHTDAFGQSQSRQKTQVAPAVPSFGNALPLKPPPQQDSRKSNKKRRTHNQLGLTPRKEDHESSSEEGNVDEEVQFASATDGCASSQQQLQFTYKGRTATLQSASDIAAWIDERKKRFPTKARLAESREKQRKVKEERQQKRKEQIQERKTAQREATAQNRDLKEEEYKDEAAKAKLRIEKLRKRLEKAERRAARAEAKASVALFHQTPGHATQKKRKRGNSDMGLTSIKDEVEQSAVVTAKSGNQEKNASPEPNIKSDLYLKPNGHMPMIKQEGEGFLTEISTVPAPLTPTSQPGQPVSDMAPENPKLPSPANQVIDDIKFSIPKLESSVHADSNENEDNRLSRDQTSTPSSQLLTSSDNSSDDDDTTSSSGSSSSSTDTEEPGIPSLRMSISTPSRAPSPIHQFGTLAVHAGSPHDPATGAVIESISLSTTFAQTAVGKPVGAYEYVRSSNPNRENFEKAVASLENARYALAFSSGSATTATILQSLAAGSHVISVSDVYGGTHRYFTKVAKAHGVQVTFSPSIEIDVEELIRPDETKLIWIESPSNPTLTLVDIREVATIAHRHGIMVVVDNTFLSPYVQNPLDHGADIVIHSVTKYINGHSDVLMGAAAFNSSSLYERLSFLQNAIGAVPSAFDCWLAHRGLKTLHLRAREASKNATIVATTLSQSPHVLLVNYPGLPSHSQRYIALKQHRDGLGGGMLSFRIKGGPEAAERFCQRTSIFTLAESLGGVESLVEVPSSMTHAGIPKDQREAAGVWDDLVRVSCGIEDAEDLKKDILQALEQAVVVPKINGWNGANGHT
ncbi:MAG: hypothetical protein Q9167_003567 [Letrouitia subvulpina]